MPNHFLICKNLMKYFSRLERASFFFFSSGIFSRLPDGPTSSKTYLTLLFSTLNCFNIYCNLHIYKRIENQEFR